MPFWTSEEMNQILLSLDEMRVPFPQYSITQKDGEIKLLGRGGSANVYEAFRRKSGKSGYALKVLISAHQSEDSELFRHSVKVQKEIGLLEDDVVKIYDYTELWVSFDQNDNIVEVSKDRPEKMQNNTVLFQFIIMEKLRAVLERNKTGMIRLFPEKLGLGEEKEVLRLAYDIGIALERAHKKNILHRDIKLENIFYSEEKKQYKLGDFGIARKTEDGFAGTVAFTKGYAAPEVLGTEENDRYDNTADIYSFGMMLFVLTNRLKFPYSKGYKVNSVQYHQGTILPRPENEEISEAFYKILLKACMYEPEQRYQSLTEMILEIEKLLFGKSLGFKKKHKTATFVLSISFFYLGLITWKLTMAGDKFITLSLWEILFLIGCVGKGILKLLHKETFAASLVLFGIGAYLLVLKGFSYSLLGILLWMLFSSGQSAGIFGTAVLIVYVLSQYQIHKQIYGTILSTYTWLVPTFLSLAFFLWLEFAQMTLKLSAKFALIFRNVSYRGLFLLMYFFIFISGTFRNNWTVYRSILGDMVIDTIQSVNLQLVGLSGMAFILLMKFREIILIKLEDKKLAQ